MQENTIKKIRHYLERLPKINSEIVVEGFSLIQSHREVNLLAEMLFAKLGFNSSQLETMEIIYHNDGNLTPAQLADERKLSRSTMTTILASLELQGYVSRSMHKGDRRMVTVTLTDKGIRYCEENLPDRYSNISKAIGALYPDERHILFNAYNTINVFLEKAWNEGTTGSAKIQKLPFL